MSYGLIVYGLIRANPTKMRIIELMLGDTQQNSIKVRELLGGTQQNSEEINELLGVDEVLRRRLGQNSALNVIWWISCPIGILKPWRTTQQIKPEASILLGTAQHRI